MSRGKKHTFWGMDINITEYKTFEIKMIDKFLESVYVFGYNVDENVTTSASSYTFIVNTQAKQLYE